MIYANKELDFLIEMNERVLIDERVVHKSSTTPSVLNSMTDRLIMDYFD